MTDEEDPCGCSDPLCPCGPKPGWGPTRPAPTQLHPTTPTPAHADDDPHWKDIP